MVRSSAAERRAGRLVGGDGVLDLGPRGAVSTHAESAEKSALEPADDVRLRARAIGRRAVGTSTLVVAHWSLGRA